LGDSAEDVVTASGVEHTKELKKDRVGLFRPVTWRFPADC